MKSKKNITTTQVRLGDELADYINRESERIGISKNSMMLVLMEDGRKFREASLAVAVHQKM